MSFRLPDGPPTKPPSPISATRTWHAKHDAYAVSQGAIESGPSLNRRGGHFDLQKELEFTKQFREAGGVDQHLAEP